MLRQLSYLLGALGLLLVAACTPVNDQTGSPAEEIRVVEVTRAVEATCPAPTVSGEPICPTAIPQVSSTTRGRVAVIESNSLTLRTGPSSAHDALGSMPFGSEVNIIGKAPGGGWVVVSAAEGLLGWMYTLYLDVDVTDPLVDVPEVQPTLSKIIAGRVVDSSGQPIENVFVSTNVSEPVSYPVMTDEQGRFALFVPKSQSGPWVVSVNGVSCSSRVADEDCYLEGFVLRNPSEVYEPEQETPLEFVYEITTMTLEGRVEDEDGNVIVDTAVFATRRDGAYVVGRSGNGGAFEIPITPGSWRLWARGGPEVFIGVEESGYVGELVLIGAGD